MADLTSSLGANLGDIDARCDLAARLRRQGRAADAVALLTDTLRLAPGHPQILNGLGSALIDLGEPEAAEEHLRAALRVCPNAAELHSNLGLALRDQNRSVEAEACFREALRLKPQYLRARVNLGALFESDGKTDEARAAFHDVLAADPGSVWALTGLGRLAATGHYSLSDAEVGRIEALASETGQSAEERSRLSFALGRVREKAGAYDEAFAHFRRANELRQSSPTAGGAAPDMASHTRLVDQLIAVCSPTYFERVRGFGSESEVPIFVVGMPRSATTLAEQILASHPRVRGAGELRDVFDFAKSLPARLGCVEPYPDCLQRLDGVTAHALAEAYLHRLRQRGGPTDRVVDKMPFNFWHLGLIAALFPRARIVHCRRDPVDTCLSCYCHGFGDPPPWGADLGDLGRYFREYERLMAHYKRVLPLPIFELRYEELTNDQEAVSRRLVEFCGLEWDDRCLRFHETERPVRTNALQVRQPLYRSSVGRWKRYEKHLGPLLEALGIDRTPR